MISGDDVYAYMDDLERLTRETLAARISDRWADDNDLHPFTRKTAELHLEFRKKANERISNWTTQQVADYIVFLDSLEKDEADDSKSAVSFKRTYLDDPDRKEI